MIKRRDFLKQSAALAATTAVTHKTTAQSKPKSKVAISKNENIETAVKNAINSIGGIKKFVKPGNKVLIKANMGFPNPPEWSTTTHPDVVKTVVQLCKDAGASRIIIADHPLRDSNLCKEKTGISDAVKNIQGCVVAMLDNEKFYKLTNNPNAKELKKVAVMKEVLKCDCLINIPTAKSHSATGVSLGIKNLMGLVWDRTAYHEKMELNRAIAEQLYIIKPHLTIVDIIYALLTNGPGGPGKVEKLNTIVASSDPVAADSISVAQAKWYNREFKGTQVKHIKIANELGFGEILPENMDIAEV